MCLELFFESKVACTSDEAVTNSRIGAVGSDMKDIGAGMGDRQVRCKTLTTGTR